MTDELDQLAALRLAEVREVLLAFAERCPAFAAYLRGRSNPTDADLVRWLILRIDKNISEGP